MFKFGLVPSLKVYRFQLPYLPYIKRYNAITHPLFGEK